MKKLQQSLPVLPELCRVAAPFSKPTGMYERKNLPAVSSAYMAELLRRDGDENMTATFGLPATISHETRRSCTRICTGTESLTLVVSTLGAHLAAFLVFALGVETTNLLRAISERLAHRSASSPLGFQSQPA